MKIQQHPLLIVCALLWACMVGSPRSAYAQMLGVTVEVDTVFSGPDNLDALTLPANCRVHELFVANFTNPTDVLSAIYSDVDVYRDHPGH